MEQVSRQFRINPCFLCKRSHVRLPARVDVATVFDHPTIAALGAFIASTTDATPLPTIIAGARPQKIPLSFSQERLWFIDALEGSVQYHIPFVLRLKGELDSQVLQKALRTIVNRHEVLRTVIQVEDGQAFQRILDENGWRLGNADHFVYTTELSLRAKIEELVQTPFNLAADCLLRADLIKTGPAEHVLVGTMHHIVSDGWSLPILVRELTELYNAFVAGRPYQLPDLPVQYADYAIWQCENLSGDVLQNKLAYWQQQLAGTSVLQLPTDHPRGPVRSTRGATASFRLDKELSGRLETLSFGSGATMYMTLLSAFNILLYKYSGQDDICVGSPIAGRPLKEIEGLIGFFVNTLVIRSRLSPDMSFRDLLLQVKKTTLDAYAHQDVPFEKIVDAVVTERDLSRNPLFDVLFTMENNTPPNILEETLSGLSLFAEGHANTTAQFDLLVNLQQQAGGITGWVTYNSDLYEPATIQRMIAHYQRLLQAIAADQDQTVDKLDMMTETERQQLLFGFNDTHTDYPRDKTIVDLFYEQAAKTPGSLAVVFEDHQLTYRQLDERSNQLAHLLRSRGVREESLVVICLERSLEMIIGILGILKAGGAYVPVDPDYPEERIAYILEDTAATIALTAGNVRLPAAGDLTAINIGTSITDIGHTARIDSQPHPDHLAYVIYTSGSTGQPKGVMIQHAGLTNRLLWAQDYHGLTGEDAVLQKTTYCFDVSVWELLWPLLTGARLVFARPDGHKDVGYLKQIIAREKITTIHFVPAMLEVFLAGVQQEDCPGLRRVLCSGEALKSAQVTLFGQQLPQVELHNLYGPTEASIDVSYWTWLNKQKVPGKVPIGKPVANMQLYILNTKSQLSPLGGIGEICIGGTGLARGYLNRPDLTAEKFIPHPFSTDPNARLYRTGDLGRWLPDGNIEFLGRLDDQVKIRGYRIEPGEIESALMQTGMVQQAVVLVREDQQGNKRLIGYIVPAAGYERDAALNQLRTKLPEYMVPTLLIELDTLPLTSNGKTDRKALLQIDLSASIQSGYEAPASPLEAQLAAIWSDLLGVERVGRHDNFFQLGGHSLLAMRLVAAIRKELSIQLSIGELIKNPTVIESANYIKANLARLVLKNMILENGHILPLSSAYKDQIIFFTPSIKGICGGIEELAQELANDFQVYGLQMMGLFENEVPFKTMEEIAAQNIKWMKTIQPHGPYIFAGHSYAGYIVYEMAKQLAGMEKKAACLLLLM